MAPNAAAGSSKNITPNWLTARSNGSSPKVRSVRPHEELDVAHARPAALSRANSTSGAEISTPTSCPWGATPSARAMDSSPPPQPISQTRWPGRAPTASRRWGDRASVSRSRLGHAATHWSWFHRFGFLLVGHRANVSVPGRFSGVRVGLVILPSRPLGRRTPPVGVGGPRRVPHGMDLRPHPLGRDAGRALARGGARAGGRRRGDRAHTAGHAGRHAELPSSGHARPRCPRAR